MFVAAAVCPHPPLLVPMPGVADSPAMADVRDASQRAVAALLDARPDIVVILGSGPATLDRDATAGGSLRPYGVDVRAGGPDVVLPLSLTLGAWLLDGADTRVDPVPRRYVALAASSSPQDCLDTGATLASGDRRVGLLVMGDGSARRTTFSPGPYDKAAVDFDASVESALGDGDTEALLRLDPVEAQRLWVAGRPAWQALAGAAASAAPIDATVLVSAAPHGVAYFVASWSVRGDIGHR